MHRTILLNLLFFLLIPLGLLIWQTGSGPPGLTVPPAESTEGSAATVVFQSDVADAAETFVSVPLTEALYAGVTAGTSRISVMQDRLAFGFSVTAEPAIAYFNGQINGQGQTVPDDPMRLLVGEHLLLNLDFTQEPIYMLVNFRGQSWWFFGTTGRLHYQVSILIPEGEPTVTWDGERLAPPLTVTIQAAALHDLSKTETREISGFDLSGHVRQLVYAQPVRP